jgi:hypothetical protein
VRLRRSLAAGALALFLGGGALAADQDVVLIKAHVLFRDPEAAQPKFECKSDDPRQEVACLRYPNSYTIDVRDVLMGDGTPRRMHAVFWLHAEPLKMFTTDWVLLGTRKSGVNAGADGIEVEVFGSPEDGICAYADAIEKLGIGKDVQKLERSGRLNCVKR